MRMLIRLVQPRHLPDNPVSLASTIRHVSFINTFHLAASQPVTTASGCTCSGRATNHTSVSRSFARSPALKRTPFFLLSTEYAPTHTLQTRTKARRKKGAFLGYALDNGREPMGVQERERVSGVGPLEIFWG